MARIRTIKPEFFTSMTVTRLSPLARLTFIALWTYVDDDGRGKDEPRLVKAAAWPLDDDVTADVVEAHLRELDDRRVIVRYSAHGERYFAVRNWHEHQKIDRPRPSPIPAPPDDRRPRRKRGEDSSKNRRGLVDDSSGEGKGREGKGTSAEMFESAWSVYPRRPGNPKAKAWRCWQARVREGESETAMLEGTRAYRAYCDRTAREPQYVMQGGTFYGPDRRYADDYGPGESVQVPVYDDRGEITPEAAKLLGIVA